MSEFLGNISTDPRQISLSSLADAADALTKAAATLAAAARATAEVLSKEAPRSPSPEESYGINLGRGSDLASEKALSEKGDTDLGYDMEGEPAKLMAAKDEQVDLSPTDTITVEQDPGNSDQINSLYRLLVESEAEVLLFVCALIDKRQKVVCYMPCGTPPLKTYMQLMEKVTESPIYILNSSNSLKGDQNYLDFLKSNGAVLLVPESLSPQFRIEGDNSWVIHVGWPVSEAQYTVQRRNHQAQNNVLVACSGDQSLYPSGNSIVKMTEPWPKDGASFRASVSILRPLYEVMLSEVPLDMKSRIYMDYIQFHGVHGPRRVESWTPSMVVRRANDYLTKVWLWSGEHTGGDDIPLPDVSLGFVSQNTLQSAVQDGLLRVEEEDSDDPGPMPSPAWDMPVIPKISNSSRPREETIDRALEDVLCHPSPDLIAIRPESELAQLEFEPTTGLTFFPYHEEFDVIPLMCFISGKYNKVICFLEGQGALRTYHDLLGRIAGRVVFFPKVLNDNQAIEEATTRFFSAATPAILLLAYNTANLPPILSRSRVDCCVYWGLTVPLQQAKKNRPVINCDTTIIVMMTNQLKGLSGAHDLRKHPSAAISLDLTENSTLAPIRNKTKAILAAPRNISIVNGLYANRVYSVASIPRRVLSAQEVARRVNQYAARVLLHGDPADGSATFPPVAGRPVIPKTAVEKFSLQPAVGAGLLTIGT